MYIEEDENPLNFKMQFIKTHYAPIKMPYGYLKRLKTDSRFKKNV